MIISIKTTTQGYILAIKSYCKIDNISKIPQFPYLL